MIVRLFLLALLAVNALAQSSTALFQQVDEIVATLSDITGWQVRKKVPSQMLSTERFRQIVETSMKKASHDKEIHIEEVTLKMFGFVPQDFDLAKEAVDLVSEQAAAFYDYNQKRLFVLDSTPEGSEQQLALAHELAHALADQHHPLGKYLNHGNPDDDATTARQAVMEGQATWLAWAYMSKHNGGKGEVPADIVDRLTTAAGADGDDFPVFSKAPLYVRESLVFPYNQGMRFQDSIYRKLGKRGFDEVFLRPPLDSQQIMHPDLYLSNLKPAEPDPPPLAPVVGKDTRQFRVLTDGALGEFDFSMLLRQYVGEREGTDAASHWRGASYRLYEHKAEKYPVLTCSSEWDTAEAARTYFELYQRVLRGKWKKMSVSVHATDEVSGSGDSGRFVLRISGTSVQAVEGLHGTEPDRGVVPGVVLAPRSVVR
jgi:hypothetical protein